MTRTRIGVAAGALGALLALVGGIALVASYWHARALAHAYRSPLATVPDLSAWLPLTTDGLLFGAFAVIYWRRIAELDVPRLAWIGAGLAGVATVAANLATAHPSVTGWIVAGWAPVTFTFVDFLVAILIPPLVTAWRAGVDTPIPYIPADTPTIAMHYRQPAVTALRAVHAQFSAPPASDDEAVAILQAEIDAGELPGKPSARSLRNRWGFNSAKAKRIIDRLQEKAS
jgi:hypothetical protein